MTAYHYRAIDAEGKLHQGQHVANGRTSLEQHLHQAGLKLIRSHISWHPAVWPTVFAKPQRYPAAALTLLTYHFSQLLSAGVPMLVALEDLAALETRPFMKRVLKDIRCRVDKGELLSDALEAHSSLFDQRYVAVVIAGEASGQLPECLVTLHTSLRWQQDVSRRLKTLTIYPAFAAVLLLSVIGFLLGFVVPSLAGFLDSNAQTLPLHTEVLLTLANYIQHHALFIIAVLVFLSVGVCWLQSSEGRWRRWVDRTLLQFGSVGTLITNLMMARYAQSVALLYRNGVELTDALSISERTIRNTVLQQELQIVRLSILEGKGFAEALLEARWVPSILQRLVAVGESTGALQHALKQASEQLQSDAAHAVDRVEALISPVLLGVLGLLLLWVIVSVVLPVYNSIMAVGAWS